MGMNRRQFIQSAAVLFCAPAIVRADSLMKLWVPPVLPNTVTFNVDFGTHPPGTVIMMYEHGLIVPWHIVNNNGLAVRSNAFDGKLVVPANNEVKYVR
jgi:hypothetical protein